MEHINDIKLLDYVGGKLAAAESEQVQRHISECTTCASRYQEALATWGALGQWRIDSSTHQIAGRIEALASQAESEQRTERRVLLPMRYSLFSALRIAAAIVISIIGGYMLGRYTAPRNVPNMPGSEAAPRYLAALDFEWSSDLTWTVLQEDTTGGVNRQ